MKIHRLAFKNINSLRGEHAIDFDTNPLKNAGLFAITGPTGAGKTTLLDVISLAIYNRIPRLSKAISKGEIQKTGLILTENTAEAWAEVEYSGKRGRFISRWSIAKARTGSLKDHEMEVFDCQAQQLFDLKKSEVPAKNEQLIGLNYEQFIRSMLLAQGEFARFLKSDKNERGKLLEKITGSEIYRLIGRKAFEKNKEFGQELERLQERERNLLAESMDPEAYAQLSEQVNTADSQLNAANSALNQWQGKIQEKQRFQKLGQELQTCEGAVKQAEEHWQQFEKQRGEMLLRHEALLPQAEALSEWQQVQRSATQLGSQEAEWEQREQEATAATQKATDQIAEVVGPEVAAQDQLAELEALEGKVGELEDQRKAARVSYLEASKRAQALATKLELSFSSQEPTEGRKLTLEAQKALQVQHVKAAATLPEEWVEDPERAQQVLESQVVKGQQWQNINATVLRIKPALQKRQEDLSQLVEWKEPMPHAIKELDHEVEVLELKVAGLRKDLVIQQQSAQLEDYRTQLTEGEPCPLCGAVHHPYAEQAPAKNQDLENEIKNGEQALRKADRARAEQKQALAQTEERMEELERDLADETSELQKAELHLAELKNELGGDWQGVTLEEFQALLTERGEALKQVLNTQTKMETLRDLEGILVGMENVLLEGKGLSQQIKEVYQGDNIRTHANQLRQTHQAAHHQLQEAEQGKARWRKELEVTLANREAIGQSLVAPLKALGYEHPSEALTALVDPAQYADWKRQESSLKQTLAGQKERKDLLEKQLKEQPLDILKADLDSLEGEKTRAQAEVVLQQEQRDQLRAQKVTQDRVRDELSNMEEKISQQRAANQKWVLLKQYIGDAEGKVFSTFAQDLTLQHLVGLANRRLSTLSPRYRLAMPTQGSDDSLAVLDQDMGQMRRSVKTLSGGESFLISLSLALGLSDLASREVDIKSLFIDEGFGTLDPETLDLTLDTLERLQAEGGKTIGVISHVEALKERIGTQIVVTPNGQGYSTLRIR